MLSGHAATYPIKAWVLVELHVVKRGEAPAAWSQRSLIVKVTFEFMFV